MPWELAALLVYFRLSMEDKICAHCGRRMEYRKKWARSWDSIRFCSDRCRSARIDPRYEAELLRLANEAGAGRAVLLTDALAPEQRDKSRAIEAAKEAARRLVAKGALVMLQNGQIVDPSRAKGPVWIRKASRV